ncbi:ComF family protein [Tenacibaculum singaporense]|uniref:ComF family protein n=1 Tax=Tenacibaculum singaporense TaxID=2358479 RepID=A0A3S8R470_9FLAO|nr:ComF family protein [Tenacibaculum singaporense]AZJ34625.1 ComF family protein [Tenacibaculum singaporense]
MQFLKEIFYLFYPNLCVNCEITLLQNETFLCTICKNDLPIIDDNKHTNVTLMSNFYGKVPIQAVHSFLFYKKKGVTQKLIHQLKYKNQPEIGIFIADWFGERLKALNTFVDVDCIIPVPLHSKKLKNRGYNQVTMFGERLSDILNVEYKPDILIRTSKTKTQTLKQRFERFSNNKTKFKLVDTTLFENKHVLLIDDVITTGATLEACANELLKAQNIKISVATMAYTQKD